MYKQYRSAPTARNHIEKNAGEICFEGFQPASRKQLNGFSTRKIAGVFPVLEPRTARGTARFACSAPGARHALPVRARDDRTVRRQL